MLAYNLLFTFFGRNLKSAVRDAYDTLQIGRMAIAVTDSPQPSAVRGGHGSGARDRRSRAERKTVSHAVSDPVSSSFGRSAQFLQLRHDGLVGGLLELAARFLQIGPIQAAGLAPPDVLDVRAVLGTTGEQLHEDQIL